MIWVWILTSEKRTSNICRDNDIISKFNDITSQSIYRYQLLYSLYYSILKFASNFRIHGLSNTWIICELGEQFYNSWTFSEIQENFQFMKNLNHIIFWKFEALWEMCKHMIILWTFLAIEKERKYKSKNNNNKPGSPRIWAGQKHAWGAGVHLNLIIWRAGLQKARNPNFKPQLVQIPKVHTFSSSSLSQI